MRQAIDAGQFERKFIRSSILDPEIGPTI